MQFTVKCFKNMIFWAVLYNSVGSVLDRGRCIFVLTNVWMKQRKSTANDSPPLIAPLPNRPPVLGEYGRLDSPWRVRSHLETPGQPKAGTVTITRPQSLWVQTHWEHDGKKLRRRDSTGGAVGPRWRGICVIINDQWWTKEKKQSVSPTKSDLPKTGLCFSVNEVESLANTLNQLLREICSELEIEGSVMHEKCWMKKVKTLPLPVSDGCDQYKKDQLLSRECRAKNFYGSLMLNELLVPL